MLFFEPAFFIFFAGYLLVHFLVPPKYRIYWIIIGSAIFYSQWRYYYIWLPFFLTLIGWTGVCLIENVADRRTKRILLIATICALFTPLLTVKYAYFLIHDVIGWVFAIDSATIDMSVLKIALPLGISFITFTLTAFVVDTYAGRYTGDRRLSTVLGYVLFFPHLIAGPILRPNELMPQLRQERPAISARFALGISIFTLGLVKKLIFADSIGAAVDRVYASSGIAASGWEYLLAIYGFSMQIYCDFSGYTDMAVGLAYILCIRLPTNFSQPYSSMSVVEFWRRWHITLSHWLRDYLYIPLGGNRLGRGRQIANLFVTMLLGGLWHGANFTFAIWGIMHGGALVVQHLLKPAFDRMGIVIPRWFAILLTFHFVSIAWIYFRAPDIATAHRVLAAPLTASWGNVEEFISGNLFSLMLLIVFFLTHRLDSHARLRLALRRVNKAVAAIVVISCWLLAIAISQGSSAKFIYFDF